MTPYADIDDLVPDRFPRALTTAETDRVPTMMEDASFLLSTTVPGLQEAVDGGNEAVAHAAMLLTVTMVKRSLLASEAQQTANPGVEQVSQAFGPYSSTVKYRTDDGNLWLYGKEWDWLLGLVSGNSAAAVSMRSPGF